MATAKRWTPPLSVPWMVLVGCQFAFSLFPGLWLMCMDPFESLADSLPMNLDIVMLGLGVLFSMAVFVGLLIAIVLMGYRLLLHRKPWPLQAMGWVLILADVGVVIAAVLAVFDEL